MSPSKKILGSSIVPLTSTDKEVCRMKLTVFGSLQVTYGRRLKRMTLQRALVAKISFFPKLINYQDILVLFDNLLWCQQKCNQDPFFSEKFGLYLKVLAYIQKRENFQENMTERQLQRLSNSFLNNLEGFSLKERNTKSVLRSIMSKVQVRASKSPGKLTKTLSPAAYIGVGYRDKGSARIPHLDGSPTWQEVAMQPIENLR
jgi:hypothetical protein